MFLHCGPAGCTISRLCITKQFPSMRLLLTLTQPIQARRRISSRGSRRAGSIRCFYHILSRIVYPIIVCQHPDQPGRYIHIDGYGRLKEAKARGRQLIDAIVFPPLDLEQRICMRQTLNAAQEPFDAVSIIQDLQELAKIRNVDTSDPEQVKTLVRDLPERVRKKEKDLLMLARLHPKAVSSMGRIIAKTVLPLA